MNRRSNSHIQSLKWKFCLCWSCLCLIVTTPPTQTVKVPSIAVTRFLASVNEKTFVLNFRQSQQTKKIIIFYVNFCLLSLYLLWLTQICIFNFDFFLFTNTRYDRELMKWNITEVRQPPKSTKELLHRSWGMPRWLVKTLHPIKLRP